MNIPWISDMPSHWETLRAKNMFKKQNRTVRIEDDVVTCFRDGSVTLRKNRRVTGFTESTQWSGYQGVRKGDLVIHVMDAFAGAIGVSDSDGKSTPVYSVCTAKLDLNNQYYAYLLREMARSGFIQALYRGIRERSSDFRFEVFAELLLPLPPRNEQDQIVRYLDWKVLFDK
jgi:type I restriction enzyme S subunit